MPYVHLGRFGAVESWAYWSKCWKITLNCGGAILHVSNASADKKYQKSQFSNTDVAMVESNVAIALFEVATNVAGQYNDTFLTDNELEELW